MWRYRIACGKETRRLAPRAEEAIMSELWIGVALKTSPAFVFGLPLLLVWGIRAVRSKLQSWKVVLDDIQKTLK